MKLGANSVLFGGFDLETAMRHLSWAGYDGIELSAIKGMCEHLCLDRWQEQVKPIQELARQYQLELLAIEEAALDEARLVTAFQACSEVGIPVINIGPGGKAGDQASLEQSLDTMARLADKAACYGVVLCVKAHVGAAIHDTPTTLAAMARISSPGFGIDMDPSHIYRAGENPVEALRQVVQRARHIHIRDCVPREGGPGAPELQACGRGNIDLLGYVRVLHEAGYQGPVDLEIIGAGQYELSRCATIAAESRGYLNAALAACGAR
jgi:sugar phosphate isomerase/epimerase